MKPKYRQYKKITKLNRNFNFIQDLNQGSSLSLLLDIWAESQFYVQYLFQNYVCWDLEKMHKWLIACFKIYLKEEYAPSAPPNIPM